MMHLTIKSQVKYIYILIKYIKSILVSGKVYIYICTLILFVYIISCIVAFSISSILLPDAVERL